LAKGVPGDLLRVMQVHQSTVLFQQITTAAANAALDGKTGTFTEVDYRGEPVLASYIPLAIPDLDWAIVAKLDTVEAFAPVFALRRTLLGTGAGIAGLVVVIALALARSLTAPIRRLIADMGILGRGELSHRVGEGRRDEIGQIATALNRMASDLQETTVSRDHVTSILDSMSDAVIVVRPPATAGDWREAVITTVNPAAATMLGRKPDEILGQPVGSLLPDITAGPSGSAGKESSGSRRC
jgi:methyl-accepting chemotaxis protein